MKWRMCIVVATLALGACGGSGGSSSGDDPDGSPADTPPGDAVPVDGAGDALGPDTPDVPVDPYGGIERVYNTTCKVSGTPTAPPALALEPVLTGLAITKPLQLEPSPDGSDAVFLVSQPGLVYMAAQVTPTGTATLWLNISDRIDDGPNEGGLLSIAFDPDFMENGHFFMNSTRRAVNGQLHTAITRMTVPDPPYGAPDLGSEVVVTTIDQKWGNHNGGVIVFGPDDMLYVGMGDGGSGGDPDGNGQNLGTLMGAFLRLDVSTVDQTGTYAIPPDNPFVDVPGARGEIWAYGMRNPWRFSFDPVGGTLWTGDVGQNEIEEVDIILKGRNYGWNIMEASQCYSPPFNCQTEGLELPVAEYPNPEEGKSVTGGFVYRGTDIPSLYGTYVFGDYVSGTIWGLTPDEETGWQRTTLLQSNLFLSAFGVDNDKRLYAIDWYFGGVYRLVAADPGAQGTPGWPPTLGETGCFSDLPSRTPADGILSYSVNVPLWSDGGGKERAIVLPEDETMTWADEDQWELPDGTILIKTFTDPADSTRALETRFLVRDGTWWRGATYQWNEEGTDALVLNTSATAELDAQTWHFPSRAECRACHTPASGQTLGWSTAQLRRDHDVFGTGLPVDQVEAFRKIGYLEGAPDDLTTAEAFALSDDDTASLASRARAYLHANCAHCHRPGALATSNIDLTYTTPLAQTAMCLVAPENGKMGLFAPWIVDPGNPDNSILLLRMETLEEGLRMPNIASSVVDPVGTALVRNWIASLDSCP